MATATRTKPRPRLTLGPLEHGQRLTLAAFEDAEFIPGFRYEIIEGRLYVSPAPNFAENFLEGWFVGHLQRYANDHPDVLAHVATRGRVFLPAYARPTVPEPDIAAYAAIPDDVPLRQINWRELAPLFVVEVLVDGDHAKDLTRNPALYLTLPSIQEYWVLNGSIDPDEPALIHHRRRGKGWVVAVFPAGSTFTSRLLPGFELELTPRPNRRRPAP